MSDSPELPPITLPAEFVIPAWRNAFLASSDDSNHDQLYRTILLEWYPDGLRFIGTDGYILLASYAAGDRWATTHTAPDHDDAPTGSVVAVAADRLMTDFLKHRASEVKAHNREKDPGPGPIDITISIGTIDEPDTPQQRLDFGDDLRRLIVSCESERIALPLYDGEYAGWRRVLAGYRPAPRAKVKTSPAMYARLGQLRTLPMDNDDELVLTMAKGNQGADLVLVTGAGRVPLEGAFLPRRDEAAAEPMDGEAA